MDYLVDELQYFSNNSTKKCYAMPSTKILFYDLTLVLEGQMNYRINGKKYVLAKNDILFLKPGTIRQREATNIPVKYVSFNFSVKSGVNLHFDICTSSSITPNMRQIVALYPSKQNLESYHTREKLACILNFILLEIMDNIKIKSSNEYITNALDYINNNIYSKITLNDIHKGLHISKEYLSQLFKKEMGKTVTDYINEQKMILAKELILSQTMSLTSIATHIGFDDYNYFSRLFKKYYGITPLAFIKSTTKSK